VKTCRYCQQPARLLKCGDTGYPYRRDYGSTWTCVPCQAWVGCHPGTEKSLGGLANSELRAAKMDAHAAFDPLWRRKMERDGCSQSKARKAGYRWLAEQLDNPARAHSHRLHEPRGMPARRRGLLPTEFGMTTATFSQNLGPKIAAMQQVHAHHRPGEEVRGQITCTKCGSRLNFTILSNGLQRGRCVARDCLSWVQ
jgi:hypothetical protein